MDVAVAVAVAVAVDVPVLVLLLMDAELEVDDMDDASDVVVDMDADVMCDVVTGSVSSDMAVMEVHPARY